MRNRRDSTRFSKLLKPNGYATGDWHVENGAYRYVCRSDSIHSILHRTIDHRPNTKLFARTCFVIVERSLDTRWIERERERKRILDTSRRRRVDRNFWQTCRKLIWDFYDKRESNVLFLFMRSRLHNKNIISLHCSLFFFFISSLVVIVATVSPLEGTLTAIL